MDSVKATRESLRSYAPAKSSTFSLITSRCLLALAATSLISIAIIRLTMNCTQNIYTTTASSNMDQEIQCSLGIALTPTYGTIVVQDSAGKVRAVAKVQGDNGYIGMMRRLSDPSSKHPSPPYRTLGESLADYPRQIFRHARMRLGLPSTWDVGRLAAMIKDLSEAAAKQTGRLITVNGAILALPSTVGLYEEDACDIFTYLDMHDLVGTHIATNHPRAINAVFAGHGYGYCEHWRDPKKCDHEFYKMRSRQTLLVDYSRGALSVDCRDLRTATGISYYDVRNVTVDFNAGSDALNGGNENEHWSRIQDHVRKILDEQLSKSLSVVLLTGESSDDIEFREAIAAAIEGYGEPTVHTSDPVYVAAKGAADLAWKAAEVQRLFPDKRYNCMGPI